ncbi:HEXXH motif-containing putative peptide modification protein [Mesorhizobium sp. M0408]|uniref:aKG-HExxH-type peptide beta-hydroxylase n=1 Tax=Mesorhizobium sp. M0408 TaxID=2956942 RepID=UPI00333AE84F
MSLTGAKAAGLPNGFAPWLWQPSSSAWFDLVQNLAARWEPLPALGLDGELIRRVIGTHAATLARWLVHPCVNAITLPKPEAKLQRDFQLAVWCAINTSEALGVATLDRPVWAWSPGGGMRLEAGAHDLTALAATLRTQQDQSPLTVDPWARSMKVPFHQLWRDVTPFGAKEEDKLKAELQLLLRALTAADQYLPECLAWVRSRTQVIVPLRKVSGEHASSSSASTLPGVVFLTLHNELQAIEALVHETAHQHLFMAETAGPLVDPRHTSNYKSPLRDDPRPLRGILLACHALAYIAAYYTDALHASISAASRLEAQISANRHKLTDALDILVANRQHLTVDGRDFLDRTVEVERYSA